METTGENFRTNHNVKTREESELGLVPADIARPSRPGLGPGDQLPVPMHCPWFWLQKVSGPD